MNEEQKNKALEEYSEKILDTILPLIERDGVAIGQDLAMLALCNALASFVTNLFTEGMMSGRMLSIVL